MQPRGRNGKPKPFSLSLFEWGLGNEKEKDLVGEGHQVATQTGDHRYINDGLLGLPIYELFFAFPGKGNSLPVCSTVTRPPPQ